MLHIREQTDGVWLERLTADIAPLIRDWNLDGCWRWQDWPDRDDVMPEGTPPVDVGIDLVARRRDDGRWVAVNGDVQLAGHSPGKVAMSGTPVKVVNVALAVEAQYHALATLTEIKPCPHCESGAASVSDLASALDEHFGIDRLSTPKQGKPRADGATVASLLWMKAAMLHQRVQAGGWLGQRRIEPLAAVKASSEPDELFRESWNAITRPDFLPVLEPALEALTAARRTNRLGGLRRALRRVAEHEPAVHEPHQGGREARGTRTTSAGCRLLAVEGVTHCCLKKSQGAVRRPAQVRGSRESIVDQSAWLPTLFDSKASFYPMLCCQCADNGDTRS